MQALLDSLAAGAGNLAAYLAAHVLLCLLPAFAIAGAMTALIPKPAVTRWLGRDVPYRVSYPAAAAAGSLIAVCSCTIVPLFAGIFRKGAGLGPAVTFLFFAPAGNILALAYTGSILGPEFAVARVLLCLVFGIGIGILMARLFRGDDTAGESESSALFAGDGRIGRIELGVLLSLVAVLLAGTLKIGVLSTGLLAVEIPAAWAPDWQSLLSAWVPFDASRGEEGVSLQGSLLIALLAAIGAAAWKGLENVVEGAGRWTAVTLALVAVTITLAAMNVTVVPGGIAAVVTGRTVAVVASMGSVALFASRLDDDGLGAWLWESWRFVKQIFGLLVVGVFLVGVAREWIRPEWIRGLAGTNDVLANFSAVAFGVFLYFPTLVEVPIARMFLDLGMHRGPLLAYLMADPELSLQSVLMISAVLGRRRTAAYVALVALFSMAAGLSFGAWIDAAGAVAVATRPG